MSDGVTTTVNRLGGWRRFGILGAGALSVAMILAVSRWASAPTMVPVISDLPIESTGAITDQLDQAGIPYQLDRGGTSVLVAADNVARARVALARTGLPSAGRPGMELFDKPAYAMTDFTQRINYRRALEGELERTIGKMRNIEAAQVHLALRESTSFRSASQPSEASVVLKLRGGEEPGPEVVRGIAQMVASSVDGLASDNVTVLDDAGRLLSSSVEGDNPMGLSSRQLTVQREIEHNLKEKAEELLAQIVGRGNARVQVSALVNFDRLERTTQTLDPERQVASTEQKAEIVPGAQGGAGSSNTATTYENSRSTEVFASALGSIRRLTVAVLVNERTADSSAAGGTRSAADLARLEGLVRNAVGFDSTRGDQVTVASVPFAMTPVPAVEPVPPPSTMQKIRENQSLVVNVVAVVLAFVIGFLSLRAIKGTLAPVGLAAGHAPGALTDEHRAQFAHAMSDAAPAARMLPEIAAMKANSETRQRVGATVSAQPEVAAKLARAWMKEA